LTREDNYIKHPYLNEFLPPEAYEEDVDFKKELEERRANKENRPA
jgi:hypothetical protein